jgi:hypothetical protein
VFGDYNGDGVVDGGDYVLSRKSLGASVPAYAHADGSGNGSIGTEDYDVWRAHYGVAVPGAAGGRAAPVNAATSEVRGTRVDQMNAGSLATSFDVIPHVAGIPLRIDNLPPSWLGSSSDTKATLETNLERQVVDHARNTANTAARHAALLALVSASEPRSAADNDPSAAPAAERSPGHISDRSLDLALETLSLWERAGLRP